MKLLNEEIDLLEIIKKIRVSQFASDVVLKPRQRDLINFFQDYNLHDQTYHRQHDGGMDRRGSRGKKAANMEDILSDNDEAT